MSLAPPIQSLSFGPSERRLFGIFYAPASEVSKPGVVLCNAFGQEAVRAHRLMRVLAERLSRQGHPVLRFDYFGTGDAMGDDADGDLLGWVQDLLQADRELSRLSGVQHTVWMGMRLGATVALRAAKTPPPTLRHVILWDVVLDGGRYLSVLRERHIDALEEAFSVPARRSPRLLARRDPSSYCDEAIGFALPATLRSQLAALVPDPGVWPDECIAVSALIEPDSPDAGDLASALRSVPAQRVRVVHVQHGTDWTSDTADNSALVPTQALMALVQLAGEAA